MYLSCIFLHLLAAEPPPSKPCFVSRFEPEMRLPDGEPLVLKCKVEGYPPPKVTWYKDGVQLKNEPHCEITSRNGDNQLKVPDAQEDDGGVYSCLITNPTGQDSTSCNVAVAGLFSHVDALWNFYVIKEIYVGIGLHLRLWRSPGGRLIVYINIRLHCNYSLPPPP